MLTSAVRSKIHTTQLCVSHHQGNYMMRETATDSNRDNIEQLVNKAAPHAYEVARRPWDVNLT